MGKKNRPKPKLDCFAPEAFKVNPFASLPLDLQTIPDDSAPAPGDKDSGQVEECPSLTPEDRKLLKAFGDDSLGIQAGKSRAKLHMRLEKKGRGGKSVTVVSGFGDWGPLEQMELLQTLRRELGIGGRFQEDCMELQGDQRQRINAWFNQRGFGISGMP